MHYTLVVTESIDPYLHSIIASDHGLGGTGEGLVEASYNQLFDIPDLKFVDVNICAYVKEIVTGNHTTLFNETRNTFKDISIPTAYCVMSLIRIVMIARALGKDKFVHIANNILKACYSEDFVTSGLQRQLECL